MTQRQGSYDFFNMMQRLEKTRLEIAFNKLLITLNRSQTLTQLESQYVEPSVISYDDTSQLSYNVNKSQISQVTRYPLRNKNSYYQLKRQSTREEQIKLEQLRSQEQKMDLQILQSIEITNFLAMDEFDQNKYLQQESQDDITSQDDYSTKGQTNKNKVQLYNEKKQRKSKNLKKLPINFNQESTKEEDQSEGDKEIFQLVGKQRLFEIKDDNLSLVDSTYSNNIEIVPLKLNKSKNNFQANDLQSRYQNQILLANDDNLESPLLTTCNNSFQPNVFSMRDHIKSKQRIMSVYNQPLTRTLQNNEINTVKLDSNKSNKYFNFTHNNKAAFKKNKKQKTNQDYEDCFEQAFKIQDSPQKTYFQTELYENLDSVINCINQRILQEALDLLFLHLRYLFQKKIFQISDQYHSNKKDRFFRYLNKIKRFKEKKNEKQLQISNHLLQQSQKMLDLKLLEENLKILESIINTIAKERIFYSFFLILACKHENLSISDLTSQYELASKRSNLRGSTNTFSQLLKHYNTQSHSLASQQQSIVSINVKDDEIQLQIKNKKKPKSKFSSQVNPKKKQINSKQNIIKCMNECQDLLQTLESKIKKKRVKNFKRLNSVANNNQYTISKQAIEHKRSLQIGVFYGQSLLRIQVVQKLILNLIKYIDYLQKTRLKQSFQQIIEFTNKKKKYQQQQKNQKVKKMCGLELIKKRYLISKLRIRTMKKLNLILKILKNSEKQQYQLNYSKIKFSFCSSSQAGVVKYVKAIQCYYSSSSSLSVSLLISEKSQFIF